MATDIEFSSCSSIVDSGFESATPRPPPRKKRIKTCEISNEKKEKTWSSIFTHHINKFSNFIEKVIGEKKCSDLIDAN